MANRNILITGGTGFVGSRLAERLLLGTDYNVTAVVHKFSGPGIARLARLPVNLIQADLLDEKSISKAAKNCHIIVHLAYGTSGDNNVKKQVTVIGTKNILKAALENDVQKVICFSTTAVHGNAPRAAVVDESAPFKKSDDVYRSSKIEAEKLIWNYHANHGLPVVVLRPSLIYGPYGFFWTNRIIKEIQSGAILVNGGNGAANLVYVDNLIDAVLLAMEKSAADGEAFNVVDDDDLTWHQVFEAYAGLIEDHPPLLSMSLKEIEDMRKGDAPNDLNSWFVKPISLIPCAIKNSLRSPELRRKSMEIPWLRFMKDRMSRATLDKMKYGENGNKNELMKAIKQPNRSLLPNNDLVELYTSQCKFSNQKIKKVLEYEQRISFSEAIKLIGSWLTYQRLSP